MFFPSDLDPSHCACEVFQSYPGVAYSVVVKKQTNKTPHTTTIEPLSNPISNLQHLNPKMTTSTTKAIAELTAVGQEYAIPAEFIGKKFGAFCKGSAVASVTTTTGRFTVTQSPVELTEKFDVTPDASVEFESGEGKIQVLIHGV